MKISVDGLEGMDRTLAEAVEGFRKSRPAPATKEEGEYLVGTADSKGIPMRRPAEQFVRQRLLKTFHGGAGYVVGGLRQMGTKHGLHGRRELEELHTNCNYLASNLSRMQYDRSLAKGYLIASGVIEGACRHGIKDRMERAGMR